MHINDFYNLPDNSEHFNINLEKDTKAFIDPHKIRCGNSQRTLLYEDKINDFMETLVSLLKMINMKKQSNYAIPLASVTLFI